MLQAFFKVCIKELVRKTLHSIQHNSAVKVLASQDLHAQQHAKVTREQQE
jgi:hypothetical protein